MNRERPSRQGDSAGQGTPASTPCKCGDDQHAQCPSSGGRSPMADVVTKQSISSELAQKMVDEAVAKAGELGVSENVAILDDGGNLKAFRRMSHGPNFGAQPDSFSFIISWATNRSVVVEACTDLAHPTWSPVGTNTLSEGWSYFSDLERTNSSGRFYRIRSP